MENSLEFNIDYCYSCGYKPAFDKIKSKIISNFPEAKVKGRVINGGSGALEIKAIREDGESRILHSKLNGDGFITESNAGEFIQKIKDFLDGKFDQKPVVEEKTEENDEKTEEKTEENIQEQEQESHDKPENNENHLENREEQILPEQKIEEQPAN